MFSITSYERNASQNYSEVITTRWSEWLSLKNPKPTNAREGVERRELSCTADGNVNWYNHYGELKKLKMEYGVSLKN